MSDLQTLSTEIEITPPDITAYKVGNVGIDYVHRFDSGKAGPNITITAIVHGNELCGAMALDTLFKLGIRPKTGTLTLCFCNVEAFHSFDKSQPFASRYIDEDFNRLWTKDALNAKRSSQELARAKEILPIIDQTDILLDLHSMSSDCLPLSLAGPQKKGIEFARELGVPAHIIVDAGHRAGARLRDYPPFIDPNSSKNALLIECGQHWRQSSADVALQASLRFLIVTGIMSEHEHSNLLDSSFSFPQQQILKVTDAITVEQNNFKFSRRFTGLDQLASKGTLIGHDGDKPILTPYNNCTLIMPTKGAIKGQTAVRLAREICL